MKTSLRPYQERGRDKAIAAMDGGGGFMLIPEQRTGKTLTALSVAEHFEPRSLLVVCPKVAIPIWEEAIRTEFLDGFFEEVVIQNYEQYVSNRKHWYKWRDKHKDEFFMIVDESHMIKARGASRSGVTRTLSRGAKYRLALTGTPIANGLADAWAQFNFIDPEIFGPFDDEIDDETGKIIKENFEGRYIRWGGYNNKQIVGYRNEDEFNRIFHKHSYRITLREAKKEGGQPPLKLQLSKIYIDLSGRSRFHYDEMFADLQTTVDKKVVKAKNVLAQITKLQQLTGGFLKTNEGTYLHVGREKLDKLHEIVRSLQSRSKFLVIARHIWEIERITTFLRGLGYETKIVRGGMPYDRKFECDAIVMQIQSGMAVDMSQADAIIFYSTDYSFLNFEQARFRVLSYSKGYARYFFLLAKDTVDEQIFQAVTRKQNLAKLVVDTYRRS